MAALIDLLVFVELFLVLIDQFSFCPCNSIYIEHSVCPCFHFLCCCWSLRVERGEVEGEESVIYSLIRRIFMSIFFIYVFLFIKRMYLWVFIIKNTVSWMYSPHAPTPSGLTFFCGLSPCQPPPPYSILAPQSPAAAAETWGRQYLNIP